MADGLFYSIVFATFVFLFIFCCAFAASPSLPSFVFVCCMLLLFVFEIGISIDYQRRPKKYLTLEETFITMVPEGKSPAEFDLEIWREYSA